MKWYTHQFNLECTVFINCQYVAKTGKVSEHEERFLDNCSRIMRQTCHCGNGLVKSFPLCVCVCLFVKFLVHSDSVRQILQAWGPSQTPWDKHSQHRKFKFKFIFFLAVVTAVILKIENMLRNPIAQYFVFPLWICIFQFFFICERKV